MVMEDDVGRWVEDGEVIVDDGIKRDCSAFEGCTIMWLVDCEGVV